MQIDYLSCFAVESFKFEMTITLLKFCDTMCVNMANVLCKNYHKLFLKGQKGE